MSKLLNSFLSVVIVNFDRSESIKTLIEKISQKLSETVTDYEIIIVDNGSNDNSLSVLHALTQENGLPNLQVYALTKQVDTDTASWVGLENALGDFVAVINPEIDCIDFISTMLESTLDGSDVVFARNTQKQKTGYLYSILSSAFNWLYKCFNGIYLTKEAPSYRILNRKVINFILQHAQPHEFYRHLPATAGFSKVNLEYSYTPIAEYKRGVLESIDKGIKLLISDSKMPMRLVTLFSLFGALSNFIYSIYVVIIAITKPDIAPGWVSLSLQQSGMFLLISLVLLVLGEYILKMVNNSNAAPSYHIAQEFNSAKITRKEKLNIEEVL